MPNMRPMLACNDTILTDKNYDRINYPVIASAKLDGRRNIINPTGTSLSRSGKLLPNIHTRTVIREAGLVGMDGELISGSPTDPNAMQNAHSAFSSVYGEPDFTFYIFDNWQRANMAYKDFWPQLQTQAGRLPSWAKIIPQTMIHSPEELDSFVKGVIDEGYEGAVVRSPYSPYKHGRSTWKQQWMLKAKEYTYQEGVIVRLIEQNHNANQAEFDELGYTRRSSHASGKIPANTLGSFWVRALIDVPDGMGGVVKEFQEFGIGTGSLTAPEKRALWLRRNEDDSCVGHIITFKHFAQSGVRKKARHGQFVSFRDPADM